MEHVRHKTCWGKNFILLVGFLLFTGFIPHSLLRVAKAQTEIPLEGQSAIIEKSLRQSIPPKSVPQDPGKSKAALLNQGKTHASDFAALIDPSANKQGIVLAKLDQVTMVSGASTAVDFVGNNLILFTVNQPITGRVLDKDGNQINDQITNAVSIQTKGKKAILTARNASMIIRNVINMDGLIEAKTVTKKHGCIFLENETRTRSKKNYIEIPCL